MTKIATILHVSDLHLVANLATDGSNFFVSKSLGAKSHCEKKLTAFIDVLIEHKIYNKFDLLLGTGDITTDGSERSLNSALSFIENEKLLLRPGDKVSTLGLNSNANKRIIIPGNHDRYYGKLIPTQRRTRLFENVFSIEREYPYILGYRHPDLDQNDSTLPTLLFYVIDSTPPSYILEEWHSKIHLFRRRQAIACGYITNGDYQSLLRGTEEIVKNKVVPGLDGKLLRINPSNCIRIAVLHHHPVIPKSNKRNTSGLYQTIKNYIKDEKISLTEMKNHIKFVQYCFRTGIQLVLFGHDHKRFKLKEPPPSGITDTPFGKPNSIYFLCCPSTLQCSEEKNGFYVIDFEVNKIYIKFYEWNKSKFEFIPQHSGWEGI